MPKVVVRESVPPLQKVIDFRLEWLQRSGYSKGNAVKIAEAVDIDWHTAVDIRQACDDETLCMRILFGS